MLSRDSAYLANQSLLSRTIQQHLKTKKTAGKSFSETYTLPVVVHVMYAEEDANHNISDEQISSGIQRLNEIFANADGTGVNANIQFQLATSTPDCQPTNGIVRADASILPQYGAEGMDMEIHDTDEKGANRLSVHN